MEDVIKDKSGSTLKLWETAIKDEAFDLIRKVVMTTSEELMAFLRGGTVSTNVYLAALKTTASIWLPACPNSAEEEVSQDRPVMWSSTLLDDLGYVQQSRKEMEVLFTFLAERYERWSVIITSNLVFSQWDKIFKDPMTTMAAVDRLVHHSVILEFDGQSRRCPADAKTENKY